MARLQRKQHLDSLEIHSVRDDVLANKPQLFSLHLLVMQLPSPFCPTFCSPAPKAHRDQGILLHPSFSSLERLSLHLKSTPCSSGSRDERCCRSLQRRTSVCLTSFHRLSCCSRERRLIVLPRRRRSVTSNRLLQPGFVSYQGSRMENPAGRGRWGGHWVWTSLIQNMDDWTEIPACV